MTKGAVALASALGSGSGAARFLSSLTLSGNRIGDAGATALAAALPAMPLLVSLRVGGNRMDAPGLGAIAAACSNSCGLLSVLDLPGCVYDARSVAALPASLARLSRLPLLTTLRLGGCRLGAPGAADSLAAALRQMPLLSSLSLCANAMGPAAAALVAEALRSLPCLSSLNLDGNPMGPEGAAGEWGGRRGSRSSCTPL